MLEYSRFLPFHIYAVRINHMLKVFKHILCHVTNFIVFCIYNYEMTAIIRAIFLLPPEGASDCVQILDSKLIHHSNN